MRQEETRLQPPWLALLRRYFLAFTALSLLWEIAQAPLYTIWLEGKPRWIAFSVLHCTGGDVLIGVAILMSMLLVGGSGWPERRSAYLRVAGAVIVLGVAYAIYSEWLNVEVRHAWQYRPFMPKVPPLGTGLSPLLQWIVVPTLSFWWANRKVREADLEKRVKEFI